jgi:hypothetical protein
MIGLNCSRKFEVNTFYALVAFSMGDNSSIQHYITGLGCGFFKIYSNILSTFAPQKEQFI